MTVVKQWKEATVRQPCGDIG